MGGGQRSIAKKRLVATGLVLMGGLICGAGLWALAAWRLDNDIDTWLSDRRSEGWQAEAQALRVTGFPLRLTATLTGLALADPETGLAWRAAGAVPDLTLTQNLWPRTALAVSWPDQHVVQTPQTTQILTTDVLTGDVIFQRNRGALRAHCPMQSATLRADTVTLRDDTGAQSSLAEVTFHMNAVTEISETIEPERFLYDVTAHASGLVLSAPLLDALGQNGPAQFERARLDLRAGFDAPWSLAALETARPQPTVLDLRVFEARWGDMELRMAADLQIDTATGRPEGTMSLQAAAWQDMLRMAVESGALPPGLAAQIRDGLTLLSSLSGHPDRIDVRLRLADGRVFLGPLPIAQAPVIRLR